MKRTLLFLEVLGMVFTFGTYAYSGEKTSTLNVSATVLEVCTVSTSPIDFGGYDGVNPVNEVGSVDVTCTTGLPYNIALDAGNNYLDGRRMTDGSGNYLLYGIYQDYFATAWGDSDYDNTYPGGTSLEDTGTGVLQAHTAQGQIGAWQSDAPAGQYTDFINVTVYY